MIVDVKIIKVGKLYLAVTSLAGITLRGKSADEPGDAARNLFWKLAGQDHDDDARVAVELGLEGVDLNSQLAIGDGSDK